MTITIYVSETVCFSSCLADPIAQVHQAFCENLLERAVDSLVKPQARKEVAGQEEEEPW